MESLIEPPKDGRAHVVRARWREYYPASAFEPVVFEPGTGYLEVPLYSEQRLADIENQGLPMTVAAIRRLTALFMFLALAGCAVERGADSASMDSKRADVTAIHALLERIQQSFNAGNLDAFMPVFADDAMILGQGVPDVVGAPAIRALYESALGQADIKVRFNTDEIEVFGDLAYERGTYAIQMADRKSGQSLGEIRSRHIHVFRRQPDGRWQTWRMMTNSAAMAPAAR